MTYTIDYPATDPDRAENAIKNAESYLGDKFNEIIGFLTAGIAAGEITSRKHVRLGMGFAGVRGYPVEAIIDKYWPTLPT